MLAERHLLVVKNENSKKLRPWQLPPEKKTSFR